MYINSVYQSLFVDIVVLFILEQERFPQYFVYIKENSDLGLFKSRIYVDIFLSNQSIEFDCSTMYLRWTLLSFAGWVSLYHQLFTNPEFHFLGSLQIGFQTRILVVSYHTMCNSVHKPIWLLLPFAVMELVTRGFLKPPMQQFSFITSL